MEGWIKIHRKMLEWEWSDEPKTLALFVNLLMLASFRKAEWHGVKIKPGQLITSLGHLAKKTGLSVRSVRTALRNLNTTHEVTSKGHSKYTVITITKWMSYQVERQTNDKQTTTSEECKECKDTASPQKARRVMNKGKTMQRTEPDEIEAVITEDGESLSPVKAPPKVSKAMYDLLKWAEEEQGFPFHPKVRLGQLKALIKIKALGIKSAYTIQDRWRELARKRYITDNGLTFWTVLSSFMRKPPQE